MKNWLQILLKRVRKSVENLTTVKNWYKIITCGNFISQLTRVDNWYQILTHVANWYQFIKDVKNWYFIVTDVISKTVKNWNQMQNTADLGGILSM